MKTVMICLVGEQPLPNILPIRHYQPQIVFLLYTDRTRERSCRLKEVLRNAHEVIDEEVPAFDLGAVRKVVVGFGTDEPHENIVFNLTGGTKPMAYACYDVARIWQRPFCYMQSEKGQSVLYHYVWTEDAHRLVSKTALEGLVTTDDFLRLQVGSYESGAPRMALEEAVYAALTSCSDIDEVIWSVRPRRLQALEVDFVVRKSNQFGVGEVKMQGDKKAIDQLNAVAEQRELGTYIKKFLISSSPVDKNNLELARAYRTEVIEVTFTNKKLQASSPKLCCEIISKALGAAV